MMIKKITIIGLLFFFISYLIFQGFLFLGQIGKIPDWNMSSSSFAFLWIGATAVAGSAIIGLIKLIGRRF